MTHAMSRSHVRVYVNARGHDLPASATALDAVQAADPEAAAAVRANRRQITDSRGLPVHPDTPVYGGAIYRVTGVRTHDAQADDAHAGDAQADGAEA